MTSFDQETTGRTVVGVFNDRARAEAAIRDLRTAGFGEDRIGVAMQDQGEQRDLEESTGSQEGGGAARGAVSGGVIGGLIGLLGALVPGVGPIVAGGVLASTLAGAGIGAATGGLVGALVDLGVPEEDARHFDHGLRSGGILVTVDAGDRTRDALAILQGHDIDLGPSRGRRFGALASGTVGPYGGQERRMRRDPAYAGPERRLATR